MSDYSERLKDPRWQKKRLEVLSRDEFRCQVCGDTKSTLHVHHTQYRSFEEPWDIPASLLVTLCAECHEDEPYQYKSALSAFLERLSTIGIRTHQELWGFIGACDAIEQRLRRDNSEIGERELTLEEKTELLGRALSQLPNALRGARSAGVLWKKT